MATEKREENRRTLLALVLEIESLNLTWKAREEVEAFVTKWEADMFRKHGATKYQEKMDAKVEECKRTVWAIKSGQYGPSLPTREEVRRTFDIARGMLRVMDTMGLPKKLERLKAGFVEIYSQVEQLARDPHCELRVLEMAKKIYPLHMKILEHFQPYQARLNAASIDEVFKLDMEPFGILTRLKELGRFNTEERCQKAAYWIGGGILKRAKLEQSQL